MGGNPFSKKMCQELLLFEDYLLNCKSPLFHKDQLVVDRERTLGLVAELRSYHCADGRMILSEGEHTAADLLDMLEETAEVAPQPAQKKTEAFTKEVFTENEEHVLSAAQAEAERILAEAREKAKYLINEATIKADVLLKQAEEKRRKNKRKWMICWSSRSTMRKNDPKN